MIPIVEIIRLWESVEHGTFGVMKIQKEPFCWTLEPPDRENVQDRSSIPAQQYTCKRIISPRYGETFEITKVPGRTHVLFHPLNLVTETKACVGLGDELGELHGKKAILDSRKTFNRFMEIFAGFEELHLTIIEVY